MKTQLTHVVPLVSLLQGDRQPYFDAAELPGGLTPLGRFDYAIMAIRAASFTANRVHCTFAALHPQDGST
jgi:hypothetical protein